MPDDADQSSQAEEKENAAEIKWEEGAQHGPRGNLHSEAEEESVDQDMPPPMPC